MRAETMNNLAQSEVFSLTLVIGTYLAALALYKKTRISLLHPLLTSILVIIVVLDGDRIRVFPTGKPPDPFHAGAIGCRTGVCVI